MTTLTVTAKGQVTFRKELLSHLGVGPGDKLDVEVMPGGRATIRAARGTGSLDDFIGLFRDPHGPVLTQDEIKTAIEEAWAGER